MSEFVKDFCRLVTDTALTDNQVIEFFDIVQSVVHSKLVIGHTENEETVEIQVIEYSNNSDHIYEILLDDQLSLDEGEEISDLLNEEFDFDFEFETSLEI